MILVIFRVGNTKGYGRHDFDYDDEKDAIRKLYELQKEEGGVYFYNVDSSRAFDSTTRLNNLADFCNDANDDEINIKDFWMLLFDIDENACMEIGMKVFENR